MNCLYRLQYFLPVLLFLGISAPAFADDDATQPTRAARITFLHGNVSVTQPGQAEPIPAQMNLPLLSGVLVTTADDGQAELEFEDGSVVRLTPNTALELDSLTADPNGVADSRLRLVHGVAFLELRATDTYQYTFRAGEDTLRPVENSTIRVDFDEPPPVFSVISGSIRIEGPQNLRAEVRAGENLRPDVDDPGQYHRNQGIVEDSWNRWNDDMDGNATQQAETTTGVRNDYAGQQGYGWSDLDANGTWYDTESGPVWQPYAAETGDFDPYGNGMWVGYATVGYVWASAYPWGWTPYRCGNWSYFHDFGWGWSPGSTCGQIGWRFHHGGQPVNIARAPESYRPIRVPSPGHGVQRPWIRVGSANPVIATGPHHDEHRGPRHIGGLPVNPVPTVQNGWRSTGGFSALRRDFPVDGRTRQVISGVESNRPVVIHSTPVQPPVAGRPAAPISPGRPIYGVQHRRGIADAPSISGTPPAVITGGNDRRRDAPVTPAPTYNSGTPNATPDHPIYTPPPAVIYGAGREQRRRDAERNRDNAGPNYAPDHPIYTPPPAVIYGTGRGQRGHDAQPNPAPANPGNAPQHPIYIPPPPVITGRQSHPTPPAAVPPPSPTPAPAHPIYTPPPAAPRQPPANYTPPPAPVNAPRPVMTAPSGEQQSGERVGGRR